MIDPSPESIRAALEEAARRRFGAERAAALGKELDALAQDLARVAAAPLPTEGEPAFFLAQGEEPPR